MKRIGYLYIGCEFNIMESSPVYNQLLIFIIEDSSRDPSVQISSLITFARKARIIQQSTRVPKHIS